MKEKLKKIQHTVRIYDDDLLSYIEELHQTKQFNSRNDVINKGIEFGIPMLYKEIFGKRLKEFGALLPARDTENEQLVVKKLKEISLTTDDIFIVLNLLEYLTTTIYNIELSKLNGISITDDEVRSGLLSELPSNLQKVKDEVVKRHNKKSR
ncbi:MAG: hypothetical protein LBT30_01475 [Clostridiales bacterium]|jgi:hypothetical protein|nr:hypothetical protein [Clostridiales bacterium]